MPTLGEELRRIREEKGITLRQVSDATHIGSRFLQSIESDSYSSLPGGIFNRGFVRSYARYLGMDEEQAVQMYNEQLQAQGGEVPRSTPRFEGIEEEPNSSWGSVALGIVVLLILAGIIYTAYRYFKGPVSPSNDPAVVVNTPTPTPSLTPSPAVSPTSSASPTTSPEATPTAAPPLAPASDLRVQLQARDADCWIKVKADDGQPTMMILKKGESREFAGNSKLVLNLGNVPALGVTLNGRAAKVPTRKNGTVAENVIITKDNLQAYLQ